MLRIEGYHALAGRAGGGLDADTILQRHSDQAVGICFPKICLGEKWKLADVVDRLDVID